MTKSEVIEALAEDISTEINEARDIVNTILNSMSNALIKGDDVQLRRFGTFKIRKHESFIGCNPKTRTSITCRVTTGFVDDINSSVVATNQSVSASST